MKTGTTFIFCLWSILAIGQVLQTDWVRAIPGNSYEQHTAVAQAPCGDLYVVGYYQDYFGGLLSLGGDDGFVAKYSKSGQLLWLKQVAADDADRLNGVVVADDHQIYLVGEFKGRYYYYNDSLVSSNEVDVFFLKIDSSGQVQWAKSSSGQGFDGGNDITLSANGNLCVTGYFSTNLTFDNVTIYGKGLRDAFVATFDTLGSLIWLEALGGPAFDQGRSIDTDNANNVYVVGSFRDAFFTSVDTVFGHGGDDAFFVKYNNQGQRQWIKTLGGSTADEGIGLKVDNNQAIYVVGYYSKSMMIDSLQVFGSKEEDGFVAKFEANGNLIWVEVLAGSFDERAHAVDVDSEDNVYIIGTLDSILIIRGDTLTNRHLNRPTDIYIAKFDSSGGYEWAQSLGHYYNDFGFDLLVENSGTFYIAGVFQDTSIFVTDTLISQFFYDAFLGKFLLDTTVAIQQLGEAEIVELLNVQIYPNPIQQKALLTYELAFDGTVQIDLYDIWGRKVRPILQKYQPSGRHELTIQQTNSTAGTYLLRIKTSKSQQIIKVVLLE